MLAGSADVCAMTARGKDVRTDAHTGTTRSTESPTTTATSLETIVSAVAAKDDVLLQRLIDGDAPLQLSVDAATQLWNVLVTHSLGRDGSGRMRLLIRMRDACLRVLESRYRRPWDESIFVKIMQMHVSLGECSVQAGDFGRADKSLDRIRRLIEELAATCPFLSRDWQGRVLAVRADYHVLALNRAMTARQSDRGAEETIQSMAAFLIACKTHHFTPAKFYSGVIQLVQRLGGGEQLERTVDFAKRLEVLIPDADCFIEFRSDLLNCLTELTIDLAVGTRRTTQFSQHLADAVAFNVRSLQLRPNVMGYFEFLKLTRLQDPGDFAGAVETTIHQIRSRIAPNEDIDGKLQVIRLIANEAALEAALEHAMQLFSAVEAAQQGAAVIVGLLEIICDDRVRTLQVKRTLLEALLAVWQAVLIGNASVRLAVQRRLISLAERSAARTSGTDNLREAEMRKTEMRKAEMRKTEMREAEMLLQLANELRDDLQGPDRQLTEQLARCYLRLGKLEEAEAALNDSVPNDSELNGSSETSIVATMLRIELCVGRREGFQAREHIRRLQRLAHVRSDHFLSLYKSCGETAEGEVQVALLRGALGCMSREKGGREWIMVHKGLLSAYYNEVVQCGLAGYQEEMESLLAKVAEEMQLDEVDGEWLLRLCWNVGVLHAKAEDYLSAMFGFRWSAVFAQRHESFRTDLFKAQFFFLTAKCCTDHSIDDADLERIVMCKELLQELTDGKAHYERLLALLEFQCLLGAGRWDRLDVLVRRLPVDIGFDRLAEIVLTSPADIPMRVHRLLLERVTESELLRESFDASRFALLYRGLANVALLTDADGAIVYFQEVVEMIKQSFGRYPTDEIVWLCSTAYSSAVNLHRLRKTQSAAGWIEVALNLLYVIPESSPHRVPLEESVPRQA